MSTVKIPNSSGCVRKLSMSCICHSNNRMHCGSGATLMSCTNTSWKPCAPASHCREHSDLVCADFFDSLQSAADYEAKMTILWLESLHLADLDLNLRSIKIVLNHAVLVLGTTAIYNSNFTKMLNWSAAWLGGTSPCLYYNQLPWQHHQGRETTATLLGCLRNLL